MAINLGDLDKKNRERDEEEFKNTFMDLDGLHISKDSYNNTYDRLKRQRQEELDRLSKQYQDELDRENAGFFTRALNTLGDLASDLGEGFLGTLEGMADWGTYRLADLSDLIGQEGWAEDLRGNADFNSTGALFGKNENPQENLFDKGWTESMEKYSYSPEIVDQVFQGVGNVGALAATTIVTGGGNLATIGASYTSAYGNARSAAKRNGASDRDANRAGIISGIAEALSEQFFSGMPGMKVEGWGDKLSGKFADKLTKYFGTRTGKAALILMDGLGEGSEEIISNMLQNAGTDLMHYYDNNYTYGMENMSGNLVDDFLSPITDSESWSQFFSAAMTSALLGSAKGVMSTKTQNKILNAYAKDNNMSFQDAKYILTGQMENAQQELIRDKAEYNSQIELRDMAKNRVLNYMENYQGQNIESQIEQQIRQEEQDLGQKFTEEQREQMKKDIRAELEDRINSRNRYTEFTQETDNERDAALVKSFQENNINNTKESHEIYNLMKTLQDNNPTAKYRLTSNEELAKMGELERVEQNGKVKYLKDGKEVSINGFKKGDTIYINADGINPYQATIGHEIAEAIKASDSQAYEQLKSLVKQVYGEGNLDDYKAIYGENLTDNVEDEYINDKLGEMFKDNKLINRVADNRNLLQKLIDEVKRLIKYVTSNSEKKQLQKLQKTLEDKYVELYKEANFKEGTQESSYSLGKHYGDLGKGNDTYYYQMSSTRRSTGHFGTGTYFVNEEYQPGESSSYAKRPTQKVEFDDYNLFKPQTEYDGFDLHDALKQINYNSNPISQELYNELLPYYEASFGTINDLLTNEEESNYSKVRELLKEAGVETEEYTGYNSLEYERDLEDKITDVLNDYYRFEAAKRDLERILGIDEEQFDKSIQEVRDAEKKYSNMNDDELLKADSLSTIFMKSLGYNGVDVRGLDQLDNTTYGSVIYDLDNKKTLNDTKYSLSSTGEMVDNQTGEKVTFDVQPVETSLPTNNTLMAIHNLNEDKLNGVLDLGGFPYPSIAITKPSTISHEGYGDISVIFKPDAINPELNAKNKVYSRDAYTPRFPTLEYKVSSNESKNIRKVIGDYDYRNPLPGDKYISEAYSIMDNLEDNINRSGLEKTLSDIKNNPAMKYVYLKDTNQPFDVVTKNEQYSSKYDNDTLQRFLDNYNGEYDLNELPSSEYDKYADTMWEAYKEQLINKYNESNFDEDTANKLLEHAKENFIKSFAERNNFAMAAYKLQKYGEDKQVLDSQATKEKLDSVVNQEEYEKWVDNLFKNIIEKKGLRNNKEYYTASGTPRSFEQLHDEYTLDNVVKILDALNDTGEESGFFYGISEIAGNASVRFNTMQDIKANENLLETIGSEEYEKMLNDISDRLGTIQENIMERGNNNSDNYFIARDNMSSVIADAARIYGEGKKIDAKKIQKMLKDYGFEATIEESQQILDMYSEMRELPTQYFESKPQRAVGFDEVGTILIPNTISDATKQRLIDNNITYDEYNPNIEGDRQAKENQYEQYMFSLSTQQQGQTGFEETKVLRDNQDYLESLPQEEYNLPSYEDLTDEEKEQYGILTKEDYKNKKKELYEQYVDRTANKIQEQVKEVARRNLELKSKDVADLRELLNNYSQMSREDIYSSDAKEQLRNYVKEHAHQEYEEQLINDEVRDLQKDIRSREFIISNDYKGEFPDGITNFKKNNPGINIKFGQNGNLDTQLQELAELYPGQVNADISYGDIPYELAELLKKEYKQTKTQEFNLTDQEIDSITNKMFYGLTNNAISDADLDKFVTNIQDKIRNKYARQMAIKEYRQLAKDMLGDISQIKDKKRGLQYQINTMKRNLRDIMNQEQASKMYDTYFKPISIHNAQIETDINEYNERVQQYNLNNQESTYTQMLGELKYNPKTTLTQQQVDDYLQKHKNKIDTKKVNSAIEEFRNIYDELIERVNEALEANGYKPIDYRKGYFPHFIEDKATSTIGKFAEKLGWKVQKGQLPTDIQGITDEFNPGKAWTSFSQQRTGDATDYNALKGMDNYLRGAMDVIYHTQDIQRLRALEAEIRYQYSDKGVQEKLDEIYNNQDLTNEEKYAQAAQVTDNIKNNPLGNFATELRNYTNNLANKKSISDRGMEQTMGRDMYSIMNNISGRVSANMVGANISSAMTNFIPITQAWSQVKTKNMLRGIFDTIKASIKDDGFSDNSVYLTNRTKQADRLFQSGLEKATQKLGKPFEAVDSFTSNVIVRAKYYQNLENGMNQVEAMDNADEFAKDVMAGRSKGDSPTMFNKKNPLTKLFTAFQLEVNNQYGYMFKDIPVDIGKEAKDKIAMAFMKMFIGAWLYNAITEKITGRKAAFSPIDMAIDDAKIITNENMDLSTKIQNIVKGTAEEAPFLGGVLGGGRLPIQGAIPYGDPLSMVLETGENIGALMDDEKRDTAINSLKKEWLKPVYYVALPVAGGQIKKMNEGLAMYNHEIPGSYTDSGKLRFEADTSPLGRLQAAVFGQYASGNAREYFDEGYSPLSEKQVQEAMDANLPIAEYREINKGITNAKKEAKANGNNQTEAEYDYIYNLPISMEQKNSLLNSKLGTSDEVVDDNGYVKYTDGSKTYWYDEDNDIVYNSKYREMDNIDVNSLTKYSNKKDISDYGNYGSLAEFNYANNNPTKYAITQQIADYDSYVKYKDDIAAIKENYNNGTQAGQKKAQQEVFNYINSLPMNQIQKLMLQKMAGGYSIKNYEQAVFNYINSLDLSKEEKQNIHKELFG